MPGAVLTPPPLSPGALSNGVAPDINLSLFKVNNRIFTPRIATTFPVFGVRKLGRADSGPSSAFFWVCQGRSQWDHLIPTGQCDFPCAIDKYTTKIVGAPFQTFFVRDQFISSHADPLPLLSSSFAHLLVCSFSLSLISSLFHLPPSNLLIFLYFHSLIQWPGFSFLCGCMRLFIIVY
jgi:hypothetical protein